MKKLFTILIFICCQNLMAQDVVHWEVGNQNSVLRYEIQQSKNANKWNTIKQVLPNQTIYNDTIIFSLNNYYRVVAFTKDTAYATGNVLVPKTALSVKVSVGNRIHYMIESQVDQLLTYSLYDMQGRILTQRLVPINYGSNNFFDNRPEVGGVYFGQFQGYFDFLTIKVPNVSGN